MRYPALAIANYFIDRGVACDDPVDHMRLQKLVYIAHGWSLAVYDAPLIQEHVEAWQYGPVIPELYHVFKRYGGRAICEKAAQVERLEVVTPEVELRDRGTIDLLEKVWDSYKEYSGVSLSSLTHQPGTPWTQTSPNGRISNTVIGAHFRELAKRGRGVAAAK